jgi:phosphate starvation-inducible membrane PsiE
MAFGIALAIAAIIGIIYGIINKNKPLGIVSVIILIMIIAVWVYFYNNPY